MMKKHLARLIMVFSLILGAVFLFSSTSEAADYDVTTINVKGILYTRGASNARINKDGQLQFYTYYDLNKNDMIKKVTCNENTTATKKIFKRKVAGYGVIKQVGDKKLWFVYSNKNSHYFVKHNDKGKVLTEVKVKIKSKYFYFYDIMEKGNKLYCALLDYSQDDKEYIEILCINKKNSKIISKKRILVQEECGLFFANNKIYTCTDDEFAVYSLKWKALATYQLPEGLSKEMKTQGVFDYAVKDNFIYFLNAKGLYKCDELGLKTFELIYDATNDDLFTKAKLNGNAFCGFCVKDDNEFYLIFNNQAGYESYAPTAIARYKKKN